MGHEGRFTFTPFSGRAPKGAASCDGLVDGAAIDLSHWPKNHTPAALKRDTSVEIALAYLDAGGDLSVVTNNHFDADGVLAVFALLEPDVARAHADLLIAAAEVGDFDEWPKDERGLRLEAAVRALAQGVEDDVAYLRVLPELRAIVSHLDAREDLWGPAWNNLVHVEERAARGDLMVERVDDIAVFVHRFDLAEVPGPILSRRAGNARRRLLAFERDGGFDYLYELPRYAWADTVQRESLRAPSRNACARALGKGWVLKGGLGMTGIVRTKFPIATRPLDVARTLASVEANAL